MLTDLAHNPTLRGMATVALSPSSISSLGGIAVDWKTETSLPHVSSKGFESEEIKSGKNMVMLLTGATGSLGRVILELLMTAPGVALVHCVAVRSLNEITQHAKIVYHTGNLTHPWLGMSESIWKHIGSSVDVIIHTAALVDHIRPYCSLRATNILPTEKLVQLSAPRRIPIHYMS
jgi:hybrid polyketide synthase/nonribosomal peptide synthetase ACE1